jgi:multidrug efflux pump subunit AcrA (membrane-fusion protein)
MHTEVDVPNPQRVLVPGLYADAELELDQTANVPTVPVQAVSHAEGKTSVMVVNSNGVLEHRPVQVGMETSTDAQIVSGLNEGEEVVVSDRGGLKAGQKVRAQPVSMMEYHENNSQ